MPTMKEVQNLKSKREKLLLTIQKLEERYDAGEISKHDYEVVHEQYERKLKELELNLGLKKGENVRKVIKRPVPSTRKSGALRGKSSTAILVLVVTVVAITLIAVYPKGANSQGASSGQTGNAPSFTLTDTDGNSFSLSDFGGKTVVLDLMATWCGPCVTEISHLRSVQDYYGDNIEIISVSVGGDSTSDLASFKTQYATNWRFAVDTNSLATKYNAVYIPTIAIIDENQNLVFTHTGVTTAASLISEINSLR